jgi:hypothetical protein
LEPDSGVCKDRTKTVHTCFVTWKGVEKESRIAVE